MFQSWFYDKSFHFSGWRENQIRLFIWMQDTDRNCKNIMKNWHLISYQFYCSTATDVENGCSLELLYFIASAQLLLPSALLLCNSPISFIVRISSIQKSSYAFFLSLSPKLKIVKSSSYIHIYFLVRQVLNAQRPVSKAWKKINGLVNRQWQAKF